MYRSRPFLILTLFALCIGPVARGADGPFVGVDLGVSEALNDNYRSHVETGAAGAPYVGYMFNHYLGVQGGLNLNVQPPDNNRDRPQANLDNRGQWTTLLGMTVGPRFQLPIGDMFDLYVTGQGGGFKGVGGRLNQLAPGFEAGGGIDYNVTRRFSVGLFGRWNRAYLAPHPTFLVGHVADDEGPKDVRWATGGIGLKYSFARAATAAPAPPPPPVAAAAPSAPAPAPTKKKLVLRSVYFDFAQAVIRLDAVPVLDEAVGVLLPASAGTVIVEGHTDDKGTDAYNLKLSRRRADAVRGYLVRHGVSATRVRAEGLGESRPVASNDTDDGRAQNRRVELRVE